MSFPDSVLQHFGDLRPHGRNRWHCRCPAHADSRPSLSLWLGRDGDKLLISCYAGCPKCDVLRAVGLKMSDLFATKKPDEMPIKRRIVATYDYTDESGALLYQVCRYEPKWFAQRRPCTGDLGKCWLPECNRPRDGWHWLLDGVRRVLYRLPELLADPTLPVVIVEGEKDADRLSTMGLRIAATTSAGGADPGAGQKWLDSYSQTLAGRRVVVIPDCDIAGQRHGQYVVGSLIAAGCQSVRLVRLPLPIKDHHGGDCSEWLNAGATASDLVALIRSTPEWKGDA